MKKFLLTAALVAAASGFSAHAESVSDAEWQFSSVRNAETGSTIYYYETEQLGAMNNVDRIQIKLAQPENIDNAVWQTYILTYEINNDKAVTISNGAGAEFVSSSVTKQGGGITLNVMFNKPVTEAGTYSIIIPEGLVSFGNMVSQEFTISDAFTIKNEWRPSFNAYTLDPADGSKVSSLNEVKVTFPNAVDLFDDDMTLVFNSDLYSAGNVTLMVNEDDEDPACRATSVEVIDAFTALIKFNTDNLGNGKYILTIPGMMFYCSAFPNEMNSGIMATYTLEKSDFNLDNYTFTPEPLVSQESLSEIVLTFDQVIKIAPNYVGDLQTGDNSIFNLRNGGDEVVACTEAGFGEDEKSVVMKYNEITEKGTYTLSLPAGLFLTDAPGMPEVASPAISATFIVADVNSVASVFEAEGTINVVDLAGRTVLSNADAAAAATLAPGIYVINGKKVVIRK